MTTVERLRGLLERATPGPWRFEPPKRVVFRGVDGPLMSRVVGYQGAPEGSHVSVGSERVADHELIAVTHEALPALLDAAEALGEFSAAFHNRGETTSLKVWNDRMKASDERARAALERLK